MLFIKLVLERVLYFTTIWNLFGIYSNQKRDGEYLLQGDALHWTPTEEPQSQFAKIGSELQNKPYYHCYLYEKHNQCNKDTRPPGEWMHQILTVWSSALCWWRCVSKSEVGILKQDS